MKTPKLRYLLLTVLLLAAGWLGYWIGYMNSIPHPGLVSLDANRAKNNNFNQNRDKTINKNDQNMKTVTDIQPNKVLNSVLGSDVHNHVLGIHRGHAKRISDSQSQQNQPRNVDIEPSSLDGESIVKDENDLVNRATQLDVRIRQEKTNDAQFKEFLHMGDQLRKDSLTVQKEDSNQIVGKIHNKTNIYNELNVGLPHGENIVKKTGKPLPLLPLGEKYLQEHRHMEPNEPGYVNPAIPKQGAGKARELHPDTNLLPPETDSYYSLIHSSKASKVHGLIHAHIQVLPKTVQQQAYIFTSSQ